MGKLREKIIFGRPKSRWKNNFKINHKREFGRARTLLDCLSIGTNSGAFEWSNEP